VSAHNGVSSYPNLALRIPARHRNHLRTSSTSKRSRKIRQGLLTRHPLTNSRAFSTFNPDQSLSRVHITKAQYVKRRSVSPPVGSEVKLFTWLAKPTSKGPRTDLPSSLWLDLRNVTRPRRSKRVKSSRKMARLIRAVYVTIMCGVSNSDSYVL